MHDEDAAVRRGATAAPTLAGRFNFLMLADLQERLQRVQRQLATARAAALAAQALYHDARSELEELRDLYAVYQAEPHTPTDDLTSSTSAES